MCYLTKPFRLYFNNCKRGITDNCPFLCSCNDRGRILHMYVIHPVIVPAHVSLKSTTHFSDSTVKYVFREKKHIKKHLLVVIGVCLFIKCLLI